MSNWNVIDEEINSLYEKAGKDWYNRLSEDNKTVLELVRFSPAIVSSMSFFGVGTSWSDELYNAHEKAYHMIRDYCSNAEVQRAAQPFFILEAMNALQTVKNTETSFNNDMIEFARIYHLSDEVIQQARNEALMKTRETAAKVIKKIRKDYFLHFCLGAKKASQVN